MKNLLFAALTLSAVVLFSCGDSCDFKEFTDRADANLIIGQTYAMDSTLVNCNAYADDLKLVINDYSDCDDVAIMGQISLFQIVLDDLDCQ